MADINPLGPSAYYGGLQNATSQVAKDAKKEKVSSSKKIKFSELLKSKQAENSSEIYDFPPEIDGMTIEDAAVFLKDAVDLAGNDVSSSATTENLMKFKKTVKQFVEFVILNNYEVKTKSKRGVSMPMQNFSKYNTKLRPKDPRVMISTINQKLDAMTRAMLIDHKNNLKLLEQVNEIKGLIVDLLQS